MCGIAGYCRVSSRGADRESPPDLEKMTRCLTHRGPDSEGFFRDAGIEPGGIQLYAVGLGARRLRVIDLETGDQPIANETGDLRVVFNGEIYNHRELRVELEALGHRFATRCDTEVLAHGYEEWGSGLPAKLRGMFAFAVWDRISHSLFLARDHFGVKPLYWARTGDWLLFASEVKSFLVFPELSRKTDFEALDQYLSFLYVPEPRTIFRRIHVLPAGHLITCREGEIEIKRYWRYRSDSGGFLSRRQAVEAIREAFEESVQAMMEADVPLGLFLSGGVDSAAILAMMARHSENPVRTFSIGFGHDEHRWDELDDVRGLVEHFDTEHREIRVEPDVVATLPRVVRHFDQPFANPTAVLLEILSREARRHTTVALMGTGGDELFAGYPRYLGMRLYQHYRRLPAGLRRGAAAWADRWACDARDGRTTAQRMRRFLESGALAFDACYARMLMVSDVARKRTLYAPWLRERLIDFDTSAFIRQHLSPVSGVGREGGGTAPLERLLATDVATYLPFNQLALGDRMSMSRSLEVRVPFVDQRLVEVAAGIPLAWNLRGGVTKALFREVMAPFLPRAVRVRSKRGLNLPIAMWLRGRLSTWLRALLSPERVARRGLFEPAAVDRLIDEHESGGRDHSLFLWALAILELWYQEYVDLA